jgi:2-phospho-L-lactate guanylyltransferase
MKIFAVVPVKDTRRAKQRLAQMLSETMRQELVLAMFRDVLDTLTKVSELAGIMVVTEDTEVTRIARAYQVRVSIQGACDGHTGAVTAASRQLAAEGLGMMAMPADIPLVTPSDVRSVLLSHDKAPSFTIVPSHDLKGSNAIVCTSADAVPLQYGPDSFYSHLGAAKLAGIMPCVVMKPRIALDIDTPADLRDFLAAGSETRAHHLASEFTARTKIAGR